MRRIKKFQNSIDYLFRVPEVDQVHQETLTERMEVQPARSTREAIDFFPVKRQRRTQEPRLLNAAGADASMIVLENPPNYWSEQDSRDRQTAMCHMSDNG